MLSDTIPRLLDYYLDNPKFSQEIERAKKEFFETDDFSKIPDLALDEHEHIDGHFNEWLVFDFKLKNGLTPLEDFFENNPKNLAMYERQIYKDLQGSEYAFLEVLKVDKGQGVKLLNLATGQEYEVRERAGSYQMQIGDLFFGRLGKIDEHWELVGTNPVGLGGMRLGKGARDFFLNMKDKISPKLTKDFLLGKNMDKDTAGKADQSKEAELTLEQSSQQLNTILSRLDLKQFVTVDLIKDWISQLKWNKDEMIPACILNILVGLREAEMETPEIDKLMKAINAFYCHIPQKALQGKSPSQMAKTRPQDEKNPKLIFTQTQIGNMAWYERAEQARQLMYQGKVDKSLKEFNQCFEMLLKDKSTNSQIYRVFANKAMTHFALAQEQEAVRLLEIALEFNPNYDFAKWALNNYETGEYDKWLMEARLRQGFDRLFKQRKRGRRPSFKSTFAKDPANRYYQWLKQFKINFKTDQLTKSDITQVNDSGKLEMIHLNQELKPAPIASNNSKKVGRNEPCPCGSGRKYKKCCGK